jgi:hypothetical protein
LYQYKIVRDDLRFTSAFAAVIGADHEAFEGHDVVQFIPVWNGVVHEFRNHLTLLLAGTSEVRAGLPASVAADLAETLDDMETSVQTVNNLLAAVDGAIKGGEQVICDVDVLIERALAMAAPVLGPRVNVTVSKGRPAAVKNRGNALECALAALIADLGRVSEFRQRAAEVLTAVYQIRIKVVPERGALTIEIESTASIPPQTSWRALLAEYLAGKVGCVVERMSDRAGFLIRFQ